MPAPADAKTYARPRVESAGLHWPTYEKMVQQESGWQHWSAPGVVKSSPTGSMRLGQLNSRFYPESDWRDPYRNLDKSISILAGHLQRFGSYRKALASYNWGPGHVGGGRFDDGRGYGVQDHSPWDGTRDWRCSAGHGVSAQCIHYLDVILGPGWPEPIDAAPAPPASTPGVPMPEYRFGFKDLADAFGAGVVGQPIADEQPLRPEEITVQFTERGLMLYHQPSNRKWFLPGQTTDPAVAVAAPPAPSIALVDARGKLPTRPGTDGQYPTRNLAAVDSVDIHYTASPVSGTVQAIAAYQVGPSAQEAFPAIAYHLIVDGAGVISWCHSLDRRVWHNGGSGRNERAIGLCYIGNSEPTSAQKRALRDAIRWCQEQLGRQLVVAGHKDSYQTLCPGPSWPGWRAEILP